MSFASRARRLLVAWLFASASVGLAQSLTVDSANSPYVVATATTFSQVTVAAGGVLVANAPITVTGDMLVQGRVTLDAGLYTLRLNVAGTLTVDPGGAVIADGLGLPGCPASGYPYSGATLDPVTLMVTMSGESFAAGGTHASRGGASAALPYGDALDPTTPGGGGSRYGSDLGGAGGGVLRISAATLVLDGSLSANGGDGVRVSGSSGGGAGGSINLTLGRFSGAGRLSANGGAGTSSAWGGAGRIKVTTSVGYAFAGRYSVRQGDGVVAGTTYVVDTSVNRRHVVGTEVLAGGEQYASVVLAPGSALTVAGAAKVTTPLTVSAGSTVTLTSERALDALSIARVDGTVIVAAAVAQASALTVKGSLVVNSTLTVRSLDTEQGAVISHDPQRTSMHLIVTERLVLVAGAALNAAGKGYPGGFGASGHGATIDPTSGALFSRSPPGTGGSHAGLGGTSSAMVAPAVVYDTAAAPRFCGGGGGGGNDSSGTVPFQGGAGGGLIRVTAGTLVVDGTVSVDGASGVGQSNFQKPPGGGAGGSIIVTADTLSGAGVFSARGASGIPYAAAGGGGFITIATATSTFAGALFVEGGAGTWPGAPGVLVQTQLPSTPLITSTPPTVLKLGTPLTYLATARGGTPLTWALLSGPPGAVVSSSGELTWQPTAVGPQSFSLQATNRYGSDTQSFVLDVLSAPTITSIARPLAQLGVPWRYDDDGVAEASGSSPLTWTATQAPAAFSIEASTGQVHWVPASLGSHSACIVASNVVGQAQQCFSVLVVSRLEGDAGTGPRFTSHPSTTATCGGEYHYSGSRLPEVDGQRPLTFSLSALEGSQVPEGLSVDVDTGELTWTPTADQRGAHPVILKVENAQGADQQAFAIVVDCADPRRKEVACSTASGAWLLLAMGVLLVRRRVKPSLRG